MLQEAMEVCLHGHGGWSISHPDQKLGYVRVRGQTKARSIPFQMPEIHADLVILGNYLCICFKQ